MCGPYPLSLIPREGTAVGNFYGGATTAGVLTYFLTKDWPKEHNIWDYIATSPDDGQVKRRLPGDNLAVDGGSYTITFSKWPFKTIKFLSHDVWNVNPRMVRIPKLCVVLRIRTYCTRVRISVKENKCVSRWR
jgi:hypothetical protein